MPACETFFNNVPRKFARLTSAKGVVRILMVRPDFNSGELGIYICVGEDATGQLIDKGYLCSYGNWEKHRDTLQQAGVKIEYIKE